LKAIGNYYSPADVSLLLLVVSIAVLLTYPFSSSPSTTPKPVSRISSLWLCRPTPRPDSLISTGTRRCPCALRSTWR
jgi:hypothetical protein